MSDNKCPFRDLAKCEPRFLTLYPGLWFFGQLLQLYGVRRSKPRNLLKKRDGIKKNLKPKYRLEYSVGPVLRLR